MFAVQKGGVEGDGETLYLIPTAEIPVTNSVRDEILAAEALPLKFDCHTPCFRSEAGSYGKDTRGMIRQHQFDKVEMVQIVHPEKSYDGARGADAATPRRSCSGSSCPTAWWRCAPATSASRAPRPTTSRCGCPAQNAYREISSCSNCEAFQARRMQARFRNAQGKPELVHTLERLGARGRAHARGGAGELPARRRRRSRFPRALRRYMGGTEVHRAGA